MGAAGSEEGEAALREGRAGEAGRDILELNGRYVKAEQKAAAIERELMVLRRRQAEREAAFEQQRAGERSGT